MSLSNMRSIGFVGVGAMGKPMVGHLATKLPKDIQIHIYDVSQEALDDVLSEHPGRTKKENSAKAVADKSVRPSPPSLMCNH